MHNDLSSFINSFGQIPGSAVQGRVYSPGVWSYSVQSKNTSIQCVHRYYHPPIDDLEGGQVSLTDSLGQTHIVSGLTLASESATSH